MITQFLYALKDIKKNIWLIIVFMIQLTVTFLFICLLMNYLLEDKKSEEKFENIYKDNFVSFRMYRNSYVPLTLSSEFNNILSKTLDGNIHGYSTISTALSSGEGINKNSTKILIGLGGFGEIFKLIPRDETTISFKPLVLIGSKVNEYKVGDSLNIGTFSSNSFKITGELPNGSSYVDSSGIHYLNDSIVILATWDVWSGYNKLDYIEQIIENIKLIDVNEKDVEEFSQRISKENGKYEILPRDINVINENKKDTREGQRIFLIFFIGITVMISVGIISSLLQLIDNNIKEYSIHRLYGAEIKDIYIRIVIYSIIIILLPLIFTAIILRNFPFEMVSFIPKIFISIFTAMSIVVTVYPMLKVKDNDMTIFLRSDL